MGKPGGPERHVALSGSAASGYRVPVRGRQRELQEIERGFDAAFAGEDAVTVLLGEPGIGKTRLLQHALQIADGRGWASMVVAPDMDSGLTPLGALVDAALHANPPLLAAGDLDPLMGADAPQYWLARLIADGLERAASQTGVLVVVDDLQWLDAGSLGAVTALLREFEGIAVYWILASRTGVYSAAHQRFMTQAASDGSLLEIAPLDRDAVDSMARDVLGNAPGPGVESAMQRTAGVPLLILELLHGLEEEGLLRTSRGMVDVDTDVVPARFGTSARERLRTLSSTALRIAQVGSLYGREFPLSGVLDVLDATAAESVSAVQELLDLGFVADTGSALVFRHDTVQAAAAESLSPSLRRAMAREVLHQRLDAGESVATLAATIASVADAGDDESIDLLFEAAAQLAATDMQGAAALVVLAANLAGGRARHSAQVASLLPLALAGGKMEEAAEIRESFLPVLSADARARMGLAVARQLTESDFDGAIREAGAALAIPGISEETKVQLLAVQALNFANKADPVGIRRSLEQTRSVAKRERDSLAIATLDATESVLLFNEGRFADALALQSHALEGATRSGIAPGLWLPEGLWMAFMHNSLGLCELALNETRARIVEARAARNVVAEAYWMMVRARALYDLGRLDDAREQAETVLELANQLHLGDFTDATAGIVLHRVALHTGEVDLRDTARPIVNKLAEGAGLFLTGRWSLALEALDSGDVQAAHAAAGAALASLADPIPSMTSPADFVDDVYLAYICEKVGDLPGVELIAQVSAARAERNADNEFVAAIARAVRGIRDRSADVVMDAVSRMDQVPRPLVTARLLEIGADIFGDTADSSAALLRALGIYESLGAARDASRVLHALRGKGVNRRLRSAADGPLGLTLREHQVAERVAAGLTTERIAEDLLVSPHTVVTHIRHIFSKWGVNTRRDIAKEFASRSK